MIIKEAELVISAADKKQWPEETYPEIVMVGKSNVGKSSLINAICNRKKLAYVGNTPGKTRLINFFLINQSLMLVDVPGYGFAKINKAHFVKFGQMMEDYFNLREQKKCMVMLVDARHKPTNEDVEMLEFARYYCLKTIVVATKMDKLKNSEIKKNLNLIKETLNLEAETLIRFSSEKKQGIDELWEEILKSCNIDE